MRLLGYDLMAWLERQVKFSTMTFGPGDRTEAIRTHIYRELDETKKDNTLEEWVDVAILALEQCCRLSGGKAAEVCLVLHAKQQVNMKRRWPDWRKLSTTVPIEHIRNSEEAETRGD